MAQMATEGEEALVSLYFSLPRSSEQMSDLAWDEGGICLKYEDVGNGCEAAIVTISRNHRRNALDWAAISSLRRLMEHLQSRCKVPSSGESCKRLACVIITGDGVAFCSGGDVKALTGGATEASDLHLTVEDSTQLVVSMTEALAILEGLDVLTVAAVNGAARGGGCELMMACDMRVMAASATLSFVQVQQGITTAWGGMYRLKKVVGRAKAIELLLLAPILDGHEAERAGVVNRVTRDSETVIDVALQWATRVALFSGSAVAKMKEGVKSCVSQQEHAEFELAALQELWPSKEHAMAVSKFLKKTSGL